MRDVVQHVGRMRRYARSLCRDQSEADDIVQESLERALRAADRFRPEGDLRAWLFAILHNVFISRTRARVRSNRHHAELADASDASLAPSQEVSSDLRRVLDLVERLPLDQRQVLLLVSMEGFSTAEVAAQLDLPVGTVRSRLARAREALRTTCRDGDAEGGDRIGGHQLGERARPFRVVGGQDVKRH